MTHSRTTAITTFFMPLQNLFTRIIHILYAFVGGKVHFFSNFIDREQKKETKERRIHHDYQSFFSVFLPKIGQGILRLLLSHELEKGILPDLAIFPTERKNSLVAKAKLPSLLNLFRSNMSDKMTLGRKG